MPETERISPRVTWFDAIGSTNAVAVSAVNEDAQREPGAPAAFPHLSVFVTENQTAGRGRRDREWVTPPGVALAASVVVSVRDARGLPLPADAQGWFPLIAGLAMTRAIRAQLAAPDQATLKWPNDVLISDKKVCGILAEMTASGDVVIGTGVNLLQTADQLPVPTATSLTLAGVNADRSSLDVVLAAYLTELNASLTAFAAAGGDPISADLLDEVSAICSTLGESVRVDLPNADSPTGVATGLDRQGRLVVERSNGEQLVVAAGDVTHLRVLMGNA